jgi:hypothetical protein
MKWLQASLTEQHPQNGKPNQDFYGWKRKEKKS